MKEQIIVVSGLPRSGTSMLMQMLVAGGLKPFVDQQRTPDQDNPQGYFEFEKVKHLNKDNTWVSQAVGQVLKVVSPLLEYLPENIQYKVIFVERHLDEILASQEKMMIRRGEEKKLDDEEMKKYFQKHLQKIKQWLKEQNNFEVLYISHRETIENPSLQAGKINQFLDESLDEEKMTQVVKPELHHNKA